MTWVKRRKGWRMSCDYNYELCSPTVHHSSAHSPTFPSLHLHHNSFSNPYVALPIIAHSPTLPLLHLCHSSFSNPSFASPTGSSLTSPGEPPMTSINISTTISPSGGDIYQQNCLPSPDTHVLCSITTFQEYE